LAGIRRAAVTAHLSIEPTWTLALALYAQLRLLVTEIPCLTLDEAMKGAGINIKAPMGKSDRSNGVVMALAKLSRAELQRCLVTSSVYFFEAQPDAETRFQATLQRRELVAAIVTEAGLDLAPFTRIDNAFLHAHPKSGVESVLEESGFKKWIEAQEGGKSKYRALLSGTKAALVDGVLAAGFDFRGFIPSSATSR